MNKVFLIVQREFLSRVTKKSFLLVTFLVPLIFPSVGFLVGYLALNDDVEQKVIRVYDESKSIQLESNERFSFEAVEGPLDSAKSRFNSSEDFGLLHVPDINMFEPKGMVLYTMDNPSLTMKNGLENRIESVIKANKLISMSLSKEKLDSLNTSVSIKTINISEGEEKETNSGLSAGIGMVAGFLIYFFLFAYGGQVMQGVIEEKSSKIVEVIVSTVKPFQLMMGKVLGIVSVGILQIMIWVVLIGAVMVGARAFVGTSPQEKMMTEVQTEMLDDATQEKIESSKEEKMAQVMDEIEGLPFTKIIVSFIFYFIGGFLLYGALFAAVGSAVDTPADAQQFMVPIMLPIIMALFILMVVVQKDPNSASSVWLSMVPFFSPIIMMGRMEYAETWEIIVSMLCLVGGFAFTIWMAGRIYRVGILMHGSKVNYKVLWKWMTMKG